MFVCHLAFAHPDKMAGIWMALCSLLSHLMSVLLKCQALYTHIIYVHSELDIQEGLRLRLIDDSHGVR